MLPLLDLTGMLVWWPLKETIGFLWEGGVMCILQAFVSFLYRFRLDGLLLPVRAGWWHWCLLSPKHSTFKGEIQPSAVEGQCWALPSFWAPQVEQGWGRDILRCSNRTWLLTCVLAVWTWSTKIAVCEGGGSCCPHWQLGGSGKDVICAAPSLWTLSPVSL